MAGVRGLAQGLPTNVCYFAAVSDLSAEKLSIAPPHALQATLARALQAARQRPPPFAFLRLPVPVPSPSPPSCDPRDTVSAGRWLMPSLLGLRVEG